MPVEVHLYRYRHPDGTAKDGATPVAVSPLGLTVYYGRTGSALRQSQTPVGQCQHGNPVREGERRTGKARQGLPKPRPVLAGRQSAGSHAGGDDSGRRRVGVLSGSCCAGSPPGLYWRWRAEPDRPAFVQAAAVAEAACSAVLTSWLPSAGPQRPDSATPGTHGGRGVRRCAGRHRALDGCRAAVGGLLAVAGATPAGLTWSMTTSSRSPSGPPRCRWTPPSWETLGLQPRPSASGSPP